MVDERSFLKGALLLGIWWCNRINLNNHSLGWMMQVSEVDWSKTEQKVAKEAFEKAYEREIAALIQEVRAQASAIAELDDMWRLHDFLSARRHDIDGKYDYSYSALLFIFARLVKEGWLHLDELKGLQIDKLSKVAALSRM
jgi:hypothetical protein